MNYSLNYGKNYGDPDGTGPNPRPAGRVTYNSAGQVTRSESGTVTGTTLADLNAMTLTGALDIAYDANGRKLTETVRDSANAAVGLVQYSYDAAGRLDCQTVRMNPAIFSSLPASACTLGTQGSAGPDRVVKYIYDAAGRLASTTSAYGTVDQATEATLAYTANGKTQYVVDAESNRTTYEYDGHDRLWRTRYPVATRGANSSSATDYEELGYDAAGNVTSRRTRMGETLTFQYDNLNRVTAKIVPERATLAATYTRDVYYVYTLGGQLESARFDSTGGEGQIRFYDGFGRLVYDLQFMDGVQRSLSSWYDIRGNREQMNFPDGSALVFNYDNLSRPTLIRDGSLNWLAGYGYNARGLLTDQSWAAAAAGTVNWAYDAASRLQTHTINVAGTANDNTTSFAYNPAGQIATQTRSNDAYAYTGHVNADRAYVANGLNQYASVAGTAFCYDANGNLTADGTYVYLYDVENRLVEKRAKANANCPASAADYAGDLQVKLRYDPLGRLYESIGLVTSTTRYLYDGDALVAEYDGPGNLLRRYVHGTNGAADDPNINTAMNRAI